MTLGHRRGTRPARMARLAGSIVVLGLALAPGGSRAQQLPSPEEMDERQAEARGVPLFAETAPLEMQLFVDMAFLKAERPDDDELAALIRLEQEEDDTWFDFPAEIRTRGVFRRESRNCSFPPLRLDVPKGAVKGTAFRRQDKLKLVFPCRDGRESYQQLVLKEYLAYRMMNILTPVSFQVRLVDVTIHDTSGEDDPVRGRGFVIEDAEAVAERNRAVESDWERFFPNGMDPDQGALVALFQFMIGNTDWSPVEMHNSVLLLDDESRYLTVPYDFDFSGIVEAPYASPAPNLSIDNVRDRLYRGFCWEGVDYEALAAHFLALRPELEALVQGTDGLASGTRRRVMDYLETFYRIVENPGLWRRQVVEACRGLPDPADGFEP